MSPLATEIYRQLRRTVRSRHSITYRELAVAVATRIATHQRSRRFHAALTEVAVSCRRAALPCLPAIVWASGTQRPSAGYYAVAHPRARTDRGRVTAWEREHAAVVRAASRYPVSP